MTLPIEIADCLTSFFQHSSCIVIKPPSLLDFYGSDIDCISQDAVADSLLMQSFFDKSNQYSLRIKKRSSSHYHIDFITNESCKDIFSLVIRIDLYQLDACFSTFRIKSSRFSLFYLSSSITSVRNISLRMLSPRYVSVFRYLEFLDKFAFYPTKFSHYEYLFNDLSDHEFKQLIADVHDNIELAPIDRLISLKRNFQLFFFKLKNIVRRFLGLCKKYFANYFFR